MKNLSLLFCLCCVSIIGAQVPFNNFETNFDLEIQIDTSTADSLWQIGRPNKILFSEAFSAPNAIITDTTETYPINQTASFQTQITDVQSYVFPIFQLSWRQKVDFESGIDGGVIEASYDEGLTWLNVFDNPDYQPEMVGQYLLDTLHNGQVGITGSTDWSWMAICWGNTIVGNLPQNVENILLRYTLISDSTDTQQEGWMMDDFYLELGFIGSATSENDIGPLQVFPNPAENELFLNFNEVESGEGEIQVYDLSGKLILSEKMLVIQNESHKINIEDLIPGTYILRLKTTEAFYQQKFIKSGR